MPKQNAGWIKLYRQMTEWCWYKDTNTKVVFLHLLLTANSSDKTVYYDGGVEVRKGHVATTYRKLSEELGLTPKQVRGAVEKLKKTQDVAITRRAQCLVISIVNYDKYQNKGNQLGNQLGNPPYINKNNKKGRGESGSSPSHPPSKNGMRKLRWEDYNE